MNICNDAINSLSQIPISSMSSHQEFGFSNFTDLNKSHILRKYTTGIENGNTKSIGSKKRKADEISDYYSLRTIGAVDLSSNFQAPLTGMTNSMKLFVTTSNHHQNNSNNTSIKNTSNRTATSDGDYQIVVGENLNSMSQVYEVLAFLGRGTFGQVVKCRCRANNRMVAIKILKNHPSYLRQGNVEIQILQTLSQEDTETHNIVRAIECFQHKNHMCLVFELLEQNLYEYLKSNKFRPMTLPEIRPIAQQVLTALSKLKQLCLIHADLKPENIMLVNPTNGAMRFRVKVIDFGSACQTSKAVQNTYLQSRYYRAPEILLGLPFHEAIDMWSLGCVLAELFLGWPLYPGSSEYDQIRYIIETQGMPPSDMMKNAGKINRFFNRDTSNNNGSNHRLKTQEEFFLESGTRTKEARKYVFSNIDQIRNVNPRPEPTDPDFEVELDDRHQFANLLQQMLQMRPDDRISPDHALNHSLLTMNHLHRYIFNKRVRDSHELMQVCRLTPAAASNTNLLLYPNHHHHHPNQQHSHHPHQPHHHQHRSLSQSNLFLDNLSSSVVETPNHLLMPPPPSKMTNSNQSSSASSSSAAAAALHRPVSFNLQSTNNHVQHALSRNNNNNNNNLYHPHNQIYYPYQTAAHHQLYDMVTSNNNAAALSLLTQHTNKQSIHQKQQQQQAHQQQNPLIHNQDQAATIRALVLSNPEFASPSGMSALALAAQAVNYYNNNNTNLNNNNQNPNNILHQQQLQYAAVFEQHYQNMVDQQHFMANNPFQLMQGCDLSTSSSNNNLPIGSINPDWLLDKSSSLANLSTSSSSSRHQPHKNNLNNNNNNINSAAAVAFNTLLQQQHQQNHKLQLQQHLNQQHTLANATAQLQYSNNIDAATLSILSNHSSSSASYLCPPSSYTNQNNVNNNNNNTLDNGHNDLDQTLKHSAQSIVRAQQQSYNTNQLAPPYSLNPANQRNLSSINTNQHVSGNHVLQGNSNNNYKSHHATNNNNSGTTMADLLAVAGAGCLDTASNNIPPAPHQQQSQHQHQQHNNNHHHHQHNQYHTGSANHQMAAQRLMRNAAVVAASSLSALQEMMLQQQGNNLASQPASTNNHVGHQVNKNDLNHLLPVLNVLKSSSSSMIDNDGENNNNKSSESTISSATLVANNYSNQQLPQAPGLLPSDSQILMKLSNDIQVSGTNNNGGNNKRENKISNEDVINNNSNHASTWENYLKAGASTNNSSDTNNNPKTNNILWSLDSSSSNYANIPVFAGSVPRNSIETNLSMMNNSIVSSIVNTGSSNNNNQTHEDNSRLFSDIYKLAAASSSTSSSTANDFGLMTSSSSSGNDSNSGGINCHSYSTGQTKFMPQDNSQDNRRLLGQPKITDVQSSHLPSHGKDKKNVPIGRVQPMIKEERTVIKQNCPNSVVSVVPTSTINNSVSSHGSNFDFSRFMDQQHQLHNYHFAHQMNSNTDSSRYSNHVAVTSALLWQQQQQQQHQLSNNNSSHGNTDSNNNDTKSTSISDNSNNAEATVINNDSSDENNNHSYRENI